MFTYLVIFRFLRALSKFALLVLVMVIHCACSSAGPEQPHQQLVTALSGSDAERLELFLRSNSVDLEAVVDWTSKGPRMTILLESIQRDEIEVVKVLLRHHASWKTVGADGESALHLAVRLKRVQIAAVLLDSGADPSWSGVADAATAFHLALLGEDKTLVDSFLSHKAVIDIGAAAFLGRTDVLSRLLDENPSLAYMPLGGALTPLHLAAAAGNTRVCELLIDRGASVNARCSSGTPLLLAASKGKASTVRLLLEQMASVSLAEHQLRTPLHVALTADVAKLLLDKGADVAATDSRGMTPLHTAAMQGRLDIAGLLIKAGADVNATNHWNYSDLNPPTNEVPGSRVDHLTPLYVAVTHNQESIVTFLLSRGADPKIRDSAGYTPLMEARILGGRASIIKLLEAVDGLE